MPAIYFFEILSAVIESGVQSLMIQERLTKDQVYERIWNEIRNNRREWFSGRVPNLNYCLPECRLAYLYVIAASNANIFKRVIEIDDDLRNHIIALAQNNAQIRLCAFGAGPGTELLAISKFFDQLRIGQTVSIDFQLLDKVQEWMSSWFGIRDQILARFRINHGINPINWPIHPNGNFVSCDVTELGRLANLGNVWNQEIYILNFILSEVFDDNPGLRGFMATVSQSAPHGARFVFIERRGYIWEKQISSIAQGAGLQLSKFTELSSQSLDPDEDPRCLGEIYRALSANGENPKQGWNVVYSIGIKA
ncbi:MAG: hypothetical protein PHQ40_12385 [Anaerolineaceae bacterium]|nr:hypothetical protein [Anaerolineaceae bacterium]